MIDDNNQIKSNKEFLINIYKMSQKDSEKLQKWALIIFEIYTHIDFYKEEEFNKNKNSVFDEESW